MIWHLFEIWLALLVAFAVGCFLGVFLYEWLARGRLANLQGRFADRVGDRIDRIKARLGVGPVWRPALQAATARPIRPPDRHAGRTARANLAETDAPDRAFAGEARGYRDPDLSRWQETDADWLAADAPEPELELTGAYESPDAPFAGGDASRADADVTAMRPVGLAAPRNSVPDDLQRIRGIGKRNEELLNQLGIFHFGQIAAWTPAEARWVGAFLAFPERIERDDWIGQATVLASGGSTGYVKAADRRRARDE